MACVFYVGVPLVGDGSDFFFWDNSNERNTTGVTWIVDMGDRSIYDLNITYRFTGGGEWTRVLPNPNFIPGLTFIEHFYYAGRSPKEERYFTLTGTPTATGRYAIANTAVGTYGVGYQEIYIQEAHPIINISGDSLPDAIYEASYSHTLTATGVAPITWSIANGTLPPGLAIAPDTGIISGTPTTPVTE